MSDEKFSCTLDTLKAVLKEPSPATMNLPLRIRSLLMDSPISQLTSSEIQEIAKYKLETKDVFDADEVFPGIYVGDLYTAQNEVFLKEKNIGYVVNCAQGGRHDQIQTDELLYQKYGIKHIGFDIIDKDDSNFLDYIDEINQFIDEALNKSGNVLIHCMMGRSRSASITAAYLIARKNFTTDEALRTIHQKRGINPNVGFLKQLLHYENLIKSAKI